MTRVRLLAIVTIAALLGVGTLMLRRSPAPTPTPRNVLLISLDTLRADHLGAYGYDRPTSPAIDSLLAAAGTVFERAYSHFPSTPASHMTIFTGLVPCAHGVYGTPEAAPLAPTIPTLPEILRREGWSTGGFTEDAWVTAELGFSRGFDHFVENKSPKLTAPEGDAATTFANALAWIREGAHEPWLAFVHTYQVHHPYAPPPGYVDRVAPDHASDRAARQMARYDGEIRYTDDLLGEFLRSLGPGLLDRTIVVLLSDHGEHFGEHGVFGHSFTLYDTLLRVPLIVRAPNLAPAGARVSASVGLVDVLPTLLDLLDLPAEPGVQGRSLVPLLAGSTIAPATLYAELPFAHLIATHDGPVKRIIDTRDARAQVFDLEADPGERTDLGTEADEPTNRRLLANYDRLCEAGRVRRRSARTPTLDPEVRSKLEALGYVP